MFKKVLVALAISVVVLPLGFVHASFDEDLHFGMHSDSDVADLQSFLLAQGLYNGEVTGNFFASTTDAVKAFQIKEGVTPVSGYFGSLTRDKANALLSGSVPEDSQAGIPEPQVNSTVDTNSIVSVSPTNVTDATIGGLQSDISDLQATQQSNLDQINSLMDTVSELTSEIGDLDARLTALESAQPAGTQVILPTLPAAPPAVVVPSGTSSGTTSPSSSSGKPVPPPSVPTTPASTPPKAVVAPVVPPPAPVPAPPAHAAESSTTKKK